MTGAAWKSRYTARVNGNGPWGYLCKAALTLDLISLDRARLAVFKAKGTKIGGFML
ncbi:MAG: hypothetical protein LBD47_08420 [Treponema sp.]|jgi:hypothetical protein|nr:hypothetical protein [Treponema sp.]